MGFTVSTDLNTLEMELRNHWREHLEPFGVEFPTECKLAQLICLYQHLGKPVKKAQLKKWLSEHDFDCNSQARHLADLGWNVGSGNSRFKRGTKIGDINRNEYMLINVDKPNPIWIENREERERKKRINKRRFEILYRELEAHWDTHLKKHEMKFFTGRSVLSQIALVALYDQIGNPVHQKEISQWYRIFGFEYSHQARGLAQKGWYVATGNPRGRLMEVHQDMSKDHLMLVSVEKPNPIWLKRTKATRSGDFSKLDWSEVLDIFKERGCAVCGNKSKHYDKGHLDSTKSATRGNIVPMCSSCNNWAGGRLLDFKMVPGTLKARPIVDSRIEEE